jgi:uncharacterized protein YecT (DUF1311 family)
MAMKRFLVACAVLLITGCCVLSEVKALQPANPLSTCAQFANKRYQARQARQFEKITLLPQNLVVEKLNGKMGSQYISKVLSGNGMLKLKGAEPLGIQFTCLLENDQKTVFFHATPKATSSVPAADPAKTCEEHAPTIGEAVPCLEKTLKQEEQKLGGLEKRIKSQGNSNAKQLLGLSGQQWKRYRDSECLRRLAVRTGGNHPDITEYECKIRKTRERIRDLNFDNE